jgi:outer membrane lipoprotein-sorting protein
MKSLIFLLALGIFLGGCTFMQRDAEFSIVDADYAKYDQQKNQIEQSYLDGEISYSEYRERMNEIEQERLKAEQSREEILFK